MRVACSECAVVVDLEGLRAVDGGFGFICNHCGQINVLAPVAEPPKAEETEPEAVDEPLPDAPLPPGMTECPKCFHRQYEKSSCHRCGLNFRLVASGAARFKSDPLEGHPLADRLRPMWNALSRDLDDRDGHEEFIRLCAEHGLLEYAGQCYRKVLSVHGEEDPRVRRYRDRVIQAALARADGLERRVNRAVTRRGKLILGLVAAALIIAVLAAGLYFIVGQTNSVLNAG